ncbi:MAG: prepilin-type N-terminal cleavage/methylation domain-containing protein [Candidatus Gracilibacteria bacterium]|nr:prepilin-type N-terminal cleavage/methylation domain-containing protein [Candidatus Gracilibacteria bacterium]
MLISKNKGFTIIEIVIAITISLFVMVIIAYFISEINNKIGSSQNKSKIYIGINDLINKINSKKNLYSSSAILVSQSGSYNVLLMTNNIKSKGLLIGVVDVETMKLDPISNYSKYGNKILALKDINKAQLDLIETSSGNAYNVEFYEDNVFPDLNMSSFSLAPFNSGAIIEANLSFFESYLPSYKGTDVNRLPKNQIYDLTLDF